MASGKMRSGWGVVEWVLAAGVLVTAGLAVYLLVNTLP